MANKSKKWSDLTISQQAKIQKRWNKVQNTRHNAGQKPYGSSGASAWLRSQGISGGGSGLVSGTQSFKKKQRRYGI